MNPAPGNFDPSTGMPAASRENLRFRFTGSGSEYFRIWTVNIFLSIITLGIYSAWAKVRRTRYFYGSTRVADASFDYHGKPFAILKGRIIALVGIVLYNQVWTFSTLLGLAVIAVIALVLPWMFWKSLQFRLHNSSYRGIRFNFAGELRQAYFIFLALPLLTMLSAYLLAPLAHQQLKKYQHENSRYGASNFSFSATIGQFYKIYLIAFAILIGGVLLIVAGLASLMSGIGLAGTNETSRILMLAAALTLIYVWVLAVFPIFLAMTQNLIWNHTTLGQHGFKADIRLGRVIFLSLTNVIGIVLTLGLFTPFAVIRMMKYKVEATTLIAAGNLDEFVALAASETTAVGEGAADLLDFDLSL